MDEPIEWPYVVGLVLLMGVVFFVFFFIFASEDEHRFERITPECIKVIEADKHVFTPDVRTEAIYCKAELTVVQK
jgi:hypothetical protein